jgi:hypothetical protein
LTQAQVGTKVVEKITISGREMDKVTLDSSETMKIGTVVASYTPSADDIDLNYLQIRYAQDTIILSGKKAILSAIQKVERLNWRLIVR